MHRLPRSRRQLVVSFEFSPMYEVNVTVVHAEVIVLSALFHHPVMGTDAHHSDIGGHATGFNLPNNLEIVQQGVTHPLPCLKTQPRAPSVGVSNENTDIS